MTGGRGPKARGAWWERQCVARFRKPTNAHAHPHIERAYGAGRFDDIGDLDGAPLHCLECKADVSQAQVWQAMREATVEMVHGDRVYSWVIQKKKGSTDPDDAMIVLAAVRGLDGTPVRGVSALAQVMFELE